MFTGIIQALGKVRAMNRHGTDARVDITAGKLDITAAAVGDSIAVNGVCLTVVALHDKGFGADVSAETLDRTTLGAMRVGDAVNLEKALTLATPLGGHLVSGHVDGVAEVKQRQEVGQSVRFVIKVPAALARYIAVKGSVCIDGVSLTVNAVQGSTFEVNIVPHTLQETTLGFLEAGGRVNIEVDLLARYLERLLLNHDPGKAGGVTRESLAGYGFLHE